MSSAAAVIDIAANVSERPNTADAAPNAARSSYMVGGVVGVGVGIAEGGGVGIAEGGGVEKVTVHIWLLLEVPVNAKYCPADTA